MDAACRGMANRKFARADPFFPMKSTEAATAGAKRICAGCPVRPDCLQAALDEESQANDQRIYGIRGGLTPEERTRLRKLAAENRAAA